MGPLSHFRGLASRSTITAMKRLLVAAVGVCALGGAGFALAQSAFEAAPVLKASDLAPASMLSGPYHKVDERVPVVDFLARFAVRSDFGVFDLGQPRFLEPEELALRHVLDPTILRRKVAALLAQASQTTGLVEAVGIERFTAWVAVESFAEPAPGPAH